MSAGNEQELLDEIQYLTKLIKSHSKASNKAALHKRPSTSVGRSTDAYRWTNRATKGVTEPPKALHHNPAAENQAKIITHRHPPPRKGTRQGRFVYTPKHSLNKSKHYNVNSLLAKNSAPERSSVYSSGGHQAQKQSGSQFVYYGRQSTTQPTITIKEPKNEDLSSKPPKITSHAPESKSPTGYPSTTCTVAKNNLVSDSQASCSLSGCSDSRKRKRTMSARASRQLTKRPRSQHSSVLKSSRYVWLAKSISHKYKSSSQVTKQHSLNRSQFNWRVSTNQLQRNEHNVLTVSPETSTDTDKLPTASGSLCRTPIHKTTPPSLSPITGVILKPSRRPHRRVSGGRTPVNSKYKWRRRLSSSGSKKVQRVPTSPLVVQSRYKLTRASLIERRTGNPFRKRLSSFTQRRVNYILRNSPHTHTSKQLVVKGSKPKSTGSRNKVWVASSGTDTCPSESEDPAVQPLQKFSTGRESKTRQGNKQWVASGVSQPSTSGARSAKKVHTKRQLGLRTPTATSSRVVMDASGRRMIRIPSSSRLTWKRASVSGTPSINRMLARNAVRRSRAYVWNSKQRSKLQEKSKQYCMFFNRFGKCNKMATCPFIHDPDKVAVCTKFLRGMCDKTDGTCLFSHKISKEKMPVCSFFLRGVCTKDNCPYVHVSVGKDAEVCQDFLRGYCPRGEQCTKLHTLDCPEFSRTGNCSRGNMCPMRHRRISGRKHLQKGSTTIKEPFAFRKVRHKQGIATSPSRLPSSDSDDSAIITPAELDFIPLDRDYAPDFIAL